MTYFATDPSLNVSPIVFSESSTDWESLTDCVKSKLLSLEVLTDYWISQDISFKNKMCLLGFKQIKNAVDKKLYLIRLHRDSVNRLKLSVEDCLKFVPYETDTYDLLCEICVACGNFLNNVSNVVLDNLINLSKQ